MARHKNVIHLSDIAPEEMEVPAGLPFGAMRQRIGRAIGAERLGYSFFTVAQGRAAFPYHFHHRNEEMIFIVEGEGILRLGTEEIEVAGGTFIACPPGPTHPHQLINTSEKELRYLVVSTMEYPDLSEYPDSKKIGAYVTSAQAGGFRALYRKDSNVSYYEGENGSEIEKVKRRRKRPGRA